MVIFFNSQGIFGRNLQTIEVGLFHRLSLTAYFTINSNGEKLIWKLL